MHCLGKALARGSMKSVAVSAFNCKGLRPYIEEVAVAEISKECKNICSLKQPSILRSINKEAINEFSWTNVGKEFNTRTPFFYKMLHAGAGEKSELIHPRVVNAASILLNTRDNAMSLVQHVNGLLLKMGKASKKV
jgi:hypothetical protein